MRVLDLFSGIGGFSLGLERAGMRTIAFCEIEPFCQAVLRKHWPNVPIFDDITKLNGSDIEAIGGCELICGGFPCQDISNAGKGEGIEGARSGLWKEYARLIGEVRPKWVVVENVSALRSRGLGTVLSDLAALGYDAEWHCIPASAIGALHKRDRLWIVAYSDSQRRMRGARPGQTHPGRQADTPQRGCAPLADASGQHGERVLTQERLQAQFRGIGGDQGGMWASEPALGRVANGVPNGSHRIKSLGNAVVPQIPEIIGRAIIEFEQGMNAAN